MIRDKSYERRYKMGVLNVILGVLLIIGGFSCMFTPLMTFIGAGYLIIVLFFVYGIAIIVKSIAAKKFGIDFIFGILSLILGVVGLVHPGDVTLTTDLFLLFMAAAWFVAQGIVSIILSVKRKNIAPDGKVSVLGIILGVLAIILGIYSFGHPLFLALTVGMLISFYFIEAGFDLIALGSIQEKAEEEAGQ